MNLLGYKSLEEVHHAAAAATSSKIHPPVDQPDHELCLFLLLFVRLVLSYGSGAGQDDA